VYTSICYIYTDQKKVYVIYIYIYIYISKSTEGHIDTYTYLYQDFSTQTFKSCLVRYIRKGVVFDILNS
jgi:hypothetical protein